MSKYEGAFAVRHEERRTFWNSTSASWVDESDQATEFTSRAEADKVVAERGGRIEDRSWVLLGHNMFVGRNLMYCRATNRGMGGSLSLDRATHYTQLAAKLNTIPTLKGERGFEMIHISEAKELAEVDDHYDDGGVAKTRRIVVKLDD